MTQLSSLHAPLCLSVSISLRVIFYSPSVLLLVHSLVPTIGLLCMPSNRVLFLIAIQLVFYACIATVFSFSYSNRCLLFCVHSNRSLSHRTDAFEVGSSRGRETEGDMQCDNERYEAQLPGRLVQDPSGQQRWRGGDSDEHVRQWGIPSIEEVRGRIRTDDTWWRLQRTFLSRNIQ